MRDYRPQQDTQVDQQEPTLRRGAPGTLSFWSEVFRIPFQILQIPLETLTYGLNRIADAAAHSFSPLAPPALTAQVLPSQNAETTEPVPESPDTTPAPHIELFKAPDLNHRDNPHGLRGDSLKLVRSRVVFVRRLEEFAFPAQEDLIADDLEPGVFEAWKIAEFVQRMADPENAPAVPPTWSHYLPATCRHENGRLRRFPPGDLKYLRVYFEVLRYSRRESLNFHERQLRVLQDIADLLGRQPPSR
jgi:hypothetical protein